MNRGAFFPLVLTGLLLAACGGGGQDASIEPGLAPEAPQPGRKPDTADPSPLPSPERKPDAADPSPLSPLQVLGLDKVAEKRIDGTVDEYEFQVQLRNGDIAQTGILARVIGHGAGTTILNGPLSFGDLAAGAQGGSQQTLKLRHDRSLPFEPAKLQWSFQASFDPALCVPQAGTPGFQTAGIAGTRVMVASADVRASLAGCRILAAGGSAADAAVTVQAVLGVTEPFGSSLAGGTLITYYHAADGTVRTFDGLSSAPANTGGATSINRAVVGDSGCRKDNALQPGEALSAWDENTNISGRAVGVPGTVKVLDMMQQRFGTRPWSSLWGEAIDLARNGFTMSQYMYENLWNDGRDGRPAGFIPAWEDGTDSDPRWGPPRCKYKDIRARYCELADTDFRRTPKSAGSLLFNADLASTMETLRDQGGQAFYDPNGPIVSAILRRFMADRYVLDASGNPLLDKYGRPRDNCYSTVRSDPYDPAKPKDTGTPARIPSLMTAQDFVDYRAIEREPLRGDRMGKTVFTAPPPSGGGLVVLANLGIAQRKFDAAVAGGGAPSVSFGSDPYLYTMMEASRLAAADRRALSGDPAYSNSLERVQAALADRYLDGRAALITGKAMSTVRPGADLPPFIPSVPGVAAVQSAQIESERGRDSTSHVSIVDYAGNALSMTTTINTHWGAHIEAGGMMLNNALSLFTKSASTLGYDVNGLQGGKRPRTSMSPSIAFDPIAVVQPGGDRRAPVPRLVWGAAGGTYIPDYVTQTFLGTFAYGLDVQTVMNADYWSGQEGTGELEITSPATERIPNLKAAYGYTDALLSPGRLRGGSSAIRATGTVDNRHLSGGADKRRAGGASGR